MTNSLINETELFESCLAMVNRVASNLARHRPSFMDREDLVQDGMIGLLQAIRSLEDRYAERQFLAYAYRRIHGSIVDNIRTHTSLSRSEYREARQIQKTAVANQAAVTAEDLFYADAVVASLFARHVVFDEEIHLEDTYPGPDEYISALQTYCKVVEVLQNTPEQQRDVFIQCAIYDQSQAEIACRLKISAGRVSQIVKHVRQKLRATIQ
ncbi:MAG: sigma-70 family RNA polymerase sigma factor [Betaproteobacteria bacterium]|nr:sigma-70 family RNA polymerase sigma factor [Betaproteobacteria bacterium]